MSERAVREPDLFRVEQVVEATGGTLLQGQGHVPLGGVFTDSRESLPGGLFVALSGENFDGARFCRAAVDGGARAVLVDRSAWPAGLNGELPDEACVIGVLDSLTALGDLAAWHRRRYPVRLVAVTGSNGKTSTKEMIAAVLGGAPDVLFNRGNFNNLIGMPRALLGLRPEHTYAVMEMGMNTPGEIDRLAQVAGPQLGVITNVHPVHLEGLGTIQAVARAKGELLEHVEPTGAVVLNADDPCVMQQASRTRARIVTFGQSPAADVRIADVRQREHDLAFELHLESGPLSIELPRLGVHNASNAAAAAAIGMIEELDPSLIKDRLETAPAPPMRMEVLELGQTKLLVDCYNANPRSVQAALTTVGQLPCKGQRLAVLGDMLELGQASAQLHRQVGRAAAEAGLDGLCAFGPEAVEIAAGAREAGLSEVLHTESISEAGDWAANKLTPGACLLLKGSRGMRLERLAESLAAQQGIDWNRGH